MKALDTITFAIHDQYGWNNNLDGLMRWEMIGFIFYLNEERRNSSKLAGTLIRPFLFVFDEPRHQINAAMESWSDFEHS